MIRSIYFKREVQLMIKCSNCLRNKTLKCILRFTTLEYDWGAYSN